MTGISFLAISDVRLVSEAFHRMPGSCGEIPFACLLGRGGKEHGEGDVHDAKLG